MHNFSISKDLKAILKKLLKKDKKLHEQAMKKVEEIANCYDAEHYKNLRHDMKELKRAHIGHFVLIFELDKKNNRIIFQDLEHHDNIYKR